MNLLKNKKEILLSNEKLSKFNFDELSNYLKDKKNLEEIKKFLNLLMKTLDLKIRFDLTNTKNFLTIFLFIYQSDIVLKSNDPINRKMKDLSFDLSISFDSLFDDYSLKNKLNFEKILNEYNLFFSQWKKRDSLIIIRPLLKSYFNLKIIRDDLLKNNKEYLHINDKLKSLEFNIKMISGDLGIKYLKEKKIPIFKNEKYFTNIEKILKKGFWDSFEENIENNKLDQIPLLLNDIKEMIKEMIKNNKKYIEDLDNEIDIDMIKNVLKTSSPDFNFIYKYINFLISKLYELQNPIEDKNTKIFKETLDTMFKNEEKISKILKYFFENYFIKLENIKKITNYILNKNNKILKIEEI